MIWLVNYKLIIFSIQWFYFENIIYYLYYLSFIIYFLYVIFLSYILK